MRATRVRALQPTVRAVIDAAGGSARASSSAETAAGDAGPSKPPTSATTSATTTISGWLRSVRAHKNVSFAEVDDGSGGVVQGVWKGAGREVLTPGAAVRLRGELKPSRGAGQALELAVADTALLGPADPETYPLQKKSLPASYLREHAHLRFRTAGTAALTRVRDALVRDMHDWYEDNEFVHVHTPLLTSSDCEGAGEVFTIAQSLPSSTSGGRDAPPQPFFPRPVNLSVSGQLHLEAPTHALGRTYTLSPAFRAEPSQTARHLAEFYMLEAEVAFVDSLAGLCDVAEASIRGPLRRLLDADTPRARRARDDLAKVAAAQRAADAEDRASHGLDTEAVASDPLAHLRAAADTPFARISYTDAIGLLKTQHAAQPFEHEPKWDDGLAAEHEKWLAGEHFKRPTFVMDYPRAMKPFYMLPSEAAESGADGADSTSAPGPTVAAFDLLIPGLGELAGGSLREHRLDALTASLESHGLDPEQYAWYTDLRRWGSVPHGGWGMGWERWVSWVTRTPNVRDVVAFPRWAGSCRF